MEIYLIVELNISVFVNRPCVDKNNMRMMSCDDTPQPISMTSMPLAWSPAKEALLGSVFRFDDEVVLESLPARWEERISLWTEAVSTAVNSGLVDHDYINYVSKIKAEVNTKIAGVLSNLQMYDESLNIPRNVLEAIYAHVVSGVYDSHCERGLVLKGSLCDALGFTKKIQFSDLPLNDLFQLSHSTCVSLGGVFVYFRFAKAPTKELLHRLLC